MSEPVIEPVFEHATVDNPEYRASIRGRVLRRRLDKARRDIRARRVRAMAGAFRLEAVQKNVEAHFVSDRVDVMECAKMRLLHWMSERGISSDVLVEALLIGDLTPVTEHVTSV